MMSGRHKPELTSGKSRWLQVGWLVLVLSPAPLLLAHLRGMWELEQYGFLPVLFLATLLIIAERWDRQSSAPKRPLGWAILATGVLVLSAATSIWSPWLGCFAFLLISASWLVSHCDRQVPNASLLYLLPPLALCLRLPLNLDNDLTSVLQRLTSRLGSFVLDLLKVPHSITGNVFELTGGNLFVEEACSGIQSVFAVSSISLLMVAYLRRPILSIPAYIAVAVFWASGFNVVRVVTIALGQEWYGIDLAHGVAHQVLGYVCLGMAIILLASTDRLLKVSLFPVPQSQREDVYNPAINTWNRFVQFSTFPCVDYRKRRLPVTNSPGTILQPSSAAPYGLLTLATVATVALIGQGVNLTAKNTRPVEVAADKPFWIPEPDLLNDKIAGFQITSHNREYGTLDLPMGQYADIWSGQLNNASVRIAISQPYPEPHGLVVCYQGVGWLINEQDVVNQTEQGMNPWYFNRASFVNANGQYGYLFYSCMNDRAESISDLASGSRRFLDRMRQLDPYRQNRWSEAKYMMIQLWATSDVPLASDEIASLEKIHVGSREVIRSAAQK
ncbi:MAG: exosortase U [Pirellulales bacterium]